MRRARGVLGFGEGARWMLTVGESMIQLYAAPVAADEAIRVLEHFVSGYRTAGLVVHRAAVTLDERQDGEPVTRVTLLLGEPEKATWDTKDVRDLRIVTARKAMELDLPTISLTLVPESEAEAVEAFGTH